MHILDLSSEPPRARALRILIEAAELRFAATRVGLIRTSTAVACGLFVVAIGTVVRWAV